MQFQLGNHSGSRRIVLVVGATTKTKRNRFDETFVFDSSFMAAAHVVVLVYYKHTSQSIADHPERA